MLNMSKKKRPRRSREGTASAIRQESGTGAAPPATVERPRRRTFTAEYKQRILREADAALASGEEGAVGALLRREGLYSSHLSEWRRAAEAGELVALSKKRGRRSRKNPLADENELLRRKVTRLEHELYKAQTIIDVQKKVAALLGRRCRR
jgi:transposase